MKFNGRLDSFLRSNRLYKSVDEIQRSTRPMSRSIDSFRRSIDSFRRSISVEFSGNNSFSKVFSSLQKTYRNNQYIETNQKIEIILLSLESNTHLPLYKTLYALRYKYRCATLDPSRLRASSHGSLVQAQPASKANTILFTS